MGGQSSGPCPDYSVNMQVVPPPFEDPNHSCYTVNDSLGMAYLGAGSSWRGGHGEPVAGFDNAYVTYTGRYSLYLHLCPAAGIAKCTIRQSGYTIKSSRSLNINSVVPLGKQNLDFGGNGSNMYISEGVNMCFSLVDSSGVEWSTSAAFSCSDGMALPLTPSFCYLNNNQLLDVDMGTLDRGTIATVAGTSAKVQKQVIINCSGTAQITAKLQLLYSPLQINGHEVIATNIQGLGVAVYLLGLEMGTLDNGLTLSFQPGSNPSLTLDFEVIRDLKVALSDIPTGKFSASAIMIMTQQ